MWRVNKRMTSKHDVIAFLTDHKLYLFAVVFSRLDSSSIKDLISTIRINTGVDLSQDDLYNLTDDDISALSKFEGEKHGYLNALVNKSIYNDDKRRANIKLLNFKFVLAGLGMFFALLWFTLFMFVQVPPENAKFIDAGIGMITSLIGCMVYGYFRDSNNKNNKDQ